MSRGDDTEPLDNEIRDDLQIRRYNEVPDTPLGYPVDSACGEPAALVSGAYFDGDGGAHFASQWQVSGSCDDFSSPLHDVWRSAQNWYQGVDQAAGTILVEEELPERPIGAWCWRVRYRDAGLGWSAWSAPVAVEACMPPG